MPRYLVYRYLAAGLIVFWSVVAAIIANHYLTGIIK